MKCPKCGGSLGKSFAAFVTKTCPKCAGLLDSPGEWQSKLVLPDYLTPYAKFDPNEATGTWWSHKTEYVDFSIPAMHPIFGLRTLASPPSTNPL